MTPEEKRYKRRENLKVFEMRKRLEKSKKSRQMLTRLNEMGVQADELPKGQGRLRKINREAKIPKTQQVFVWIDEANMIEAYEGEEENNFITEEWFQEVDS